jgi:hypothetical protein
MENQQYDGDIPDGSLDLEGSVKEEDFDQDEKNDSVLTKKRNNKKLQDLDKTIFE